MTRTFGNKMKELFSFSGKADRSEWWIITIITDLVAQLCLIFGLISLETDTSFRYFKAVGLFLCVFVALWLSISVSVRRFRDRGYSPWLLLAGLVPVIGWIWYLIECGFLPAPRSKQPRKLVRRTVKKPAEQGGDGDAEEAV